MGKDPAMPWYVNDWFSSPRVQAMTQAQELAYLRLLGFCWASQDASIPDDDEQLAAMSRMGKGWLNGGSTVVRKCFKQHPTKPEALTNQRLYDLWIERQEWRKKSAEGGKKSGVSRRGARRTKGGSTKHEPNGNSSSSSSSSSSLSSSSGDPASAGISSSPRNGVGGAGGRGSDEFERFWLVFPEGRKKSKKPAREAWMKAIQRATPETIVAAAAEYARSDEGRGRYVKMPATWLNGDCWDDDRRAWQERHDPRGNLSLLDNDDYDQREADDADVIDEEA